MEEGVTRARILLAAGGSGGHIFPAAHTGRWLAGRGHEVVLAGPLGVFLDHLEGPFRVREIPMGRPGDSWKTRVRFSGSMLQSLAVGRRILREEAPSVVVGFGGYGALPAALAALSARLPLVVHEQNVRPGRANLWLSRRARTVAVSFPGTEAAFGRGAPTVVTGCPCEPDPGIPRIEARRMLGLDPEGFVVLVLGGSQGSRRLNEIMPSVLRGWPPSTPLQVVHLTGRADEARTARAYAGAGVTARVEAFSDRMGVVYRAADVAVARAGAVAVTEIALFGLPAVLVPYPFAGGHQRANAEMLVERGAAEIVEQADLTVERMTAALRRRLRTAGGMDGIRRRLEGMIRPDAAEALGRLIERTAEEARDHDG